MAKTVKIYSTATCPYCVRSKEYLAQNNISFQNYDVGQDQEALKEMREKSGQLGVPVFDIDGKIIVGFDKAAIDRELEIG